MAVIPAMFDSRLLADSAQNHLCIKKDDLVSANEDQERTSRNADEIQIEKLVKKLPVLNSVFELRKKIGEGTFSSVYLASLKCQQFLKENEKKLYAVKHLVPTSHPNRIEQELWCLQSIGGSDNVIGVELCLRKFDTVVFVMPYIPHAKFSEYMHSMGVNEIRQYIRALLIALKRVHQFGVIHRDVKPSNFLYDRQNNRFLLVDFGLAQKIIHVDKTKMALVDSSSISAHRKRKISCEFDSPVLKKIATSESYTPLKLLQRDDPKVSSLLKLQVEPTPQKIPRIDYNEVSIQNNGVGPNETCALNLTKNSGSLSFDTSFLGKNSLADQNSYPIDYSLKSRKNDGFRTPVAQESNRLQQKKVFNSSLLANSSLAPSRTNAKSSHSTNAFRIGLANKTPSKDCRCYGRPMICNSCLVRSGSNAPRAGTQGFRPPEVLLKYQEQTTAVDIWACGVIFLSILSGRYPFFKAPDDITALAELVSLFGSKRLQKIAAKLGKHLLMSHNVEPMDLLKTCKQLRLTPKCNGHVKTLNNTSQNSSISVDYVYCEDELTEDQADKYNFPESAFDLMVRLLDPNPFTRITAELALSHPFLTC